jgi:Flp pilus assembly pilin Flp
MWVYRLPAQDAAEFGLLIATVAVLVLLAVTALGGQVDVWFHQLAGRVVTLGS